jgi:hypothetical protein
MTIEYSETSLTHSLSGRTFQSTTSLNWQLEEVASSRIDISHALLDLMNSRTRRYEKPNE